MFKHDKKLKPVIFDIVPPSKEQVKGIQENVIDKKKQESVKLQTWEDGDEDL